eukprot:Nk52_evm20s2209 gene=Nk52_evmTU20s2209
MCSQATMWRKSGKAVVFGAFIQALVLVCTLLLMDTRGCKGAPLAYVDNEGFIAGETEQELTSLEDKEKKAQSMNALLKKAMQEQSKLLVEELQNPQPVGEAIDASLDANEISIDPSAGPRVEVDLGAINDKDTSKSKDKRGGHSSLLPADVNKVDEEAAKTKSAHWDNLMSVTLHGSKDEDPVMRTMMRTLEGGVKDASLGVVENVIPGGGSKKHAELGNFENIEEYIKKHDSERERQREKPLSFNLQMLAMSLANMLQ